MADKLELLEGEVVELEVKGDYWENVISKLDKQKSGKFYFTNKRIVFATGIFNFTPMFEIYYSNIESVEKCNIGPLVKFLPTGIMVTAKDGNSYRFSVLKREKYIEYIESKL